MKQELCNEILEIVFDKHCIGCGKHSLHSQKWSTEVLPWSENQVALQLCCGNLTSRILAQSRNCCTQQHLRLLLFHFSLVIWKSQPWKPFGHKLFFTDVMGSFQLTSPRPTFYPLCSTKFCEMPSKKGLSTQWWHLVISCTDNGKKDLRLWEYLLTCSRCHAVKFQGINALCACT